MNAATVTDTSDANAIEMPTSVMLSTSAIAESGEYVTIPYAVNYMLTMGHLPGTDERFWRLLVSRRLPVDGPDC
jgi:hypothetical protein